MVDRELGVPFPGSPLPRELWSSTLWKGPELPIRWESVFGREAPRVLDIGCGSGRFLIASALARPEHDHLGIERIRPLLERASRLADERGLKNIRFVAGDAVEWLCRRLGSASIDELHIYHPQPYYDPEEAALGMLTAQFIERAWEVLRPEGILVLQTDHRAYGRYLLEAIRRHFDPSILERPWPDAPEGRTRREIVARRKGLRILRILARHRPAPIEADLPPPYFDPQDPGRGRRPVRRQRRPGRSADSGRKG